jgi:hypothetical protein
VAKSWTRLRSRARTRSTLIASCPNPRSMSATSTAHILPGAGEQGRTGGIRCHPSRTRPAFEGLGDGGFSGRFDDRQAQPPATGDTVGFEAPRSLRDRRSSIQAAGSDLKSVMRRPDLGFAIPIALDMQAFRERPLCRRFDFHLIRPWEVCASGPSLTFRKTAKLIESCFRRRFDLHAARRNLLHEQCQCRLTARSVDVHRP